MHAMHCRRCGAEEQIPTHQYVKFDVNVHYLCSPCWEEFRRWFHQGRHLQRPMRQAA